MKLKDLSTLYDEDYPTEVICENERKMVVVITKEKPKSLEEGGYSFEDGM